MPKFILVADHKQPQDTFFTEWKVLVLVLIVLLILGVLFPRYLLKKTMAYDHQPSAAMLSYLKSFQILYPQDRLLQLAIIEQEIGLNHLQQAQEAFAALKIVETTPSTDMLNQFRWIDYLILRYQTYQTKMNTQERIRELAQLRTMATAMADVPLASAQLQILAQDNLGLAQAAIALKIYNHLFDLHALTTTAELEAGGNIAMQNNAHADSAKFYWALFHRARQIKEKKYYAMKTLQVLWAGNLLQNALAIAEQLPESVLNDRETLIYLAHLAMAANRPEMAQTYALKALRLPARPQKGGDDEVYQLAYQTLIYNSNITMAYALAQIGVARHPQSVGWHEKLAKTATWVGEYNTAMREWLYVVQHTKDRHTMVLAISIAKTLGYDSVLAPIIKQYLSHYPHDAEALLLLAITQNKLYHPAQALQTLKTLHAIHPSRSADELTAAIYEDIGQWDKALQTWQHVNSEAPDMRSVMAAANIYYTQGQFYQAVQTLKRGIPLAKPQDKTFWGTLGDLAWHINNRRLATLGYSHDLNDYSHLVNLISLETIPHPSKALFYSMRGWHHFHKTLFFLNAMSLAEQLKRWPVIESLLLNLSTSDLNEVANTQEFWQAQSNLYAAFGEKTAQKNVLIQAVLSHPEFLSLKNDLLWFFMSNGYSQWVTWLLSAWQSNMHDPALWYAFATGYDVINEFYAAIAMYQLHLFEQFQADQVLIDYAAVLGRIQFYRQADDVRTFVWQRALRRLTQQKIPDQKTLETLSQLSPFYVSGTEQIDYLNAVLRQEVKDNDQAINIALNWMVERNDIELMEFFKTYYLHNGLPYKVDIILALAKHDLPALQKMIELPEQPFLRAERINAAIQLENTPLAETLAFQELTARPWASEIYTEFEQYSIQDANNVNIGQEYEQFINLVGPRTLLAGKVRLTNQWKLRPYIKRWDVGSNNTSILTNVPSQDLQAGVKLEEKIHRGMVTYTLGYRDALNAFAPLDVDVNYRLSGRWTANFNVGVNQEVFQTAYMRIGGVQDQLQLTTFYNIDKYDLLQMGIEGLNYYGQDRHYLADGVNLHGLYERRLWLTYPDFTVGVFADYDGFNRNGNYSGDITTLFPSLTPAQQVSPEDAASIQAANYQQVIPPSYAQGGFIFSFGNAILDYTHEWRPYVWASMYYNTFVGWSNDVKLGLNGTVFGRDSLLLYGERGTAQAVSNSLNYTVGARYVVYL